MWSRITYTFREMWASLSRNLTLTVAAVITATVSLFLMGLTFLIQRAFDNQLGQWTENVEMTVFLNSGATDDQVQFIQTELEQQTAIVRTVEYCDVNCALDTAQRLFAGDPAALRQLTPESIPTFFTVVPVNKDNLPLLRDMQTSLEGFNQVLKVSYPTDQITVLRELKDFFGLRTLVMSGVLLFASALLIWNTIRTAMFARRREIEVMKLVGATDWFIRLPFMLEGLLQGLAGGALASGFLLFVNDDWTDGVRGFPVFSGLEGFVVTDGYPWTVVAVMLGLGAAVGAIGSGIAATKFLDV
jgi:cell division transport system permease protein